MIQDQISITRGTDGSITRDATRTSPNGRTVSDSLVYAAPQNGTRAVSGTATNAAGVTAAVTGSFAKTANGYDRSLSVTNAAGATATRDTATVRDGDTTRIGIRTTSFSGATHSHREALTITHA